jgi:hypothetical protein
LATATKKTVQLRMSASLYSQARAVMEEIEQVHSFNDFAVNAIKEEIKRAKEARIDAAFSMMATDAKYRETTARISQDFEYSDWDALQIGEGKKL